MRLTDMEGRNRMACTRTSCTRRPVNAHAEVERSEAAPQPRRVCIKLADLERQV
jgi:hypothetical protein